MTGGGRDRKNRYKSCNYFYKFLKNLKCFVNNLYEKVKNLNKKLTFIRYDKIGGAGPRAQKSPGASVFGLFIYQTVCRKITKIVSGAKRKPSDRCTEKYCSSGIMYPGTEKNTARSGSLPSRCLSDRCTRNTAYRRRLVNENLTFAAYERKASAACYLGKYSLTTICRRIAKIVSDAERKPSNRCTKKIPDATSRCLRAANCGSILIEFAVCMPVLIILLFYIHDLVKIKRMYSQTEFVAQQAANILQNLAKKRAAAGETLKYEDLCHAASLAFLSIYPGKTMYATVDGQDKHEFIHEPFFIIYYVKGTSEGKAKCVWGKSITTFGNAQPPWRTFADITSYQTWSLVKYNSNEVAASSIYPTLKTENDKPKIILETALWWSKSKMDKNGNKVSTAREVFGLHLVNPKRHYDLYFNSVVIFSPNAGFSEIRPDS